MNDLQKGICRLSLVALRQEPSYEAQMISQLLFGEHYTITDRHEDWIRIKLYCDDSEGWIHLDQHDEITTEYFDQINLSDYKVCTDISGSIFFQKKHVSILIGSILPISTNELFKLEEQVAYNGSSKSLSQRRDADFLKEISGHYLHAPYLPGGKSPFGIDAAGFIQQVFKICGYGLRRTMKQQVLQGSQVDGMNDLLPGDVVYSGENDVVNASIFLPNKEFIGMLHGRVQKYESPGEAGTIQTIRRHLHSI